MSADWQAALYVLLPAGGYLLGLVDGVGRERRRHPPPEADPFTAKHLGENPPRGFPDDDDPAA